MTPSLYPSRRKKLRPRIATRGGGHIVRAVAIACLAGCSAADGLPATSGSDAFPGAEGHGRYAAGGRGGRIIQVTTLADSGPGSLRACIDASGPRVCVFRVSGVIRFTSARPMIRNPFITIAGQTAPGGGILLTHNGGATGLTPLVIKNTHDVIVRHIRVRTDRRGAQRGSNDGITIEGSSNVIIDHVSASWALDENFNGYAQNDRITVSASIFAEGITDHDKCALLSSDPTGPQRFSFIKNLCAHNGDRNPDVNFPPGSCVEVVNNVLYNARSEFTEVWESYGGTPVSVVGNYYKAGPDTLGSASAINRQIIASTGAARVYVADNSFDGRMVAQSPLLAPVLISQPTCPLTFAPLSASQAYATVLELSGAFPRDAVDLRIVRDVGERTGRIVSAPGTLPAIATGTPYPDSDRDGMSDTWERSKGLNVGTNDAWSDHDGNGWANIDEFLDYAHREALRARAVT